ncbi:MAG: hypothetical protein IJW12_03400 [Opitutales bacterium]|nr:hypothetical protein [Opitutales bacterium]
MDNLTEVCNAALNLIGQEPISNYEDETTGVHLTLKAQLNPVIREVQCLARWPELMQVAELSREGNFTTAMGVPYALPTDSLKLVRVGDAQREYSYEEVGTKLWVRGDDAPDLLNVVYLRFSEDPQEWSPILTTGIVKLLAARILGGIAHDLSGASGLEQRFWQEYFPTVSSQIEDKLRVHGQVDGSSLSGLCESALRLLGLPPVSDWQGDSSVPAAALRSCVFPVIREVQSLTRWPELIALRKLQWTGGSDASRGYCFYKPKNCLRVLSAGTHWEEEGGYLFVKGVDLDAGVGCRFVRYSENPSEWSSELFGLTVKLLAARVACAGAGDLKTGQALEHEFWTIHRPRVVTQILNRARLENNYTRTKTF